MDSFDYSDYEGATYLHDMNSPIPEQHKNQYSLLIDGGATEHIFNVPAVYRNIMEMVEVGGYIISIVPANNFCGHGFYQFSPEFFYSLFSLKNGFEVKAMAYCSHGANYGTLKNKLWTVPNPIKLGKRVEIKTPSETELYVCAKKISDTPKVITPQQSDYENVSWNKTDRNNPIVPAKNKMIIVAKKLFPRSVKRFIKNIIAKEKREELKLH